MKALIAISSCWDFEKNLSNDALRKTWLPDVSEFPGLEYKFFVGHGQGAESAMLPDDCVLLSEVPDGYGHLTYKTRASLRWAHEREYSFVLRCFPDTYIRVDRLMACGFEGFDYFGDFRRECTESFALNYASGGPGYWLSRKAYQHLLDAPILGIWRDELMTYVEDMWTGNILGRARQAGHELSYFDDPRFMNHGSRHWPSPDNELISSHLSCPDRYEKETMYAAHGAWKG